MTKSAGRVQLDEFLRAEYKFFKSEEEWTGSQSIQVVAHHSRPRPSVIRKTDILLIDNSEDRYLFFFRWKTGVEKTTTFGLVTYFCVCRGVFDSVVFCS